MQSASLKTKQAEGYVTAYRAGASRYLIDKYDLDSPFLTDKDRAALIAQYVAKD